MSLQFLNSSNVRTAAPLRKKKSLLKIILQSVLAIFKAKIFHISGIAKFNIPAVATGKPGLLPHEEGSLTSKAHQQ